MSQDLTVKLANQVAEADVLEFVAGVLDGAELHPTYVYRPADLNVYARPLDAEELADEPEVLGVRPRTRVVVQVLGGVPYETYDAARVTAVRLALRCLERFGDGLVLSDYNELVVLLRLGATTTRNSLWYWDEYPQLAGLVAALPEAELTSPELTG